jgi:hypothetical protein
MGYWLDSRGLIPGRGKIYRFSTSSKPAPGPTQPPIQWVGVGALLPGEKQTGHEADHSSPTTAEVKKMWIYISTPLYVLIKDRDNFTFFFSPFIYK